MKIIKRIGIGFMGGFFPTASLLISIFHFAKIHSASGYDVVVILIMALLYLICAMMLYYGIGEFEETHRNTKHGEWIGTANLCGIEVLKCSVCGEEHARKATAFCCDCGAKMDGGKTE